MAKISVYLDDRTLEQLRREAARRHGSMRSISREVEEIVRESFLSDQLRAALGDSGDGDTVVGFADVKPLRLSPGLRVADMIRTEREHLDELLPRHKRSP